MNVFHALHTNLTTTHTTHITYSASTSALRLLCCRFCLPRASHYAQHQQQLLAQVRVNSPMVAEHISAVGEGTHPSKGRGWGRAQQTEALAHKLQLTRLEGEQGGACDLRVCLCVCVFVCVCVHACVFCVDLCTHICSCLITYQ